MDKDFNIDIDIYVEDSLRSSGCLFPETDEQMTIYEKTLELKELPQKFQRPTFVFESLFGATRTRLTPRSCTSRSRKPPSTV